MLLLCAAPLLMALAASSNQKDAAPVEPRYDTATNVDVMVVVVEIKDVAVGNPLNGMHLMEIGRAHV